MQLLRCALWLLFLGAALAGPLYWLAHRGAARRPVPKRAAPPDSTNGILFLTHACAQALDTCAAPSCLRRMDPKRIKKKLEAAAVKPMPLPAQYETWPQQARMLCAGERDALTAWQRQLREQFHMPQPAVEARAHPQRTPRRPLEWLLGLMLAFLLLSLLAWNMFYPCKGLDCGLTVRPNPSPAPVSSPAPAPAPAPAPNPAPPTVEVPAASEADPPVSTVQLSSDLLFEYKRAEPMSKVHAEKVKKLLNEVFRQRDGIEIKEITGHTDPIGSTSDNKSLGKKRAEFIRNQIKDLMAHPVRPSQFVGDKELVVTTSNGPNIDEFAIWSACFSAFNARPKEPPRARPLVNLDPTKNDDRRVPCDQANAHTGERTRYPACARLPIPEQGSAVQSSYPARAERLREMIACLAPMRHVEIKFESRPIATGKATASNDR